MAPVVGVPVGFTPWSAQAATALKLSMTFEASATWPLAIVLGILQGAAMTLVGARVAPIMQRANERLIFGMCGTSICIYCCDDLHLLLRSGAMLAEAGQRYVPLDQRKHGKVLEPHTAPADGVV
jgi:hypothetical protein